MHDWLVAGGLIEGPEGLLLVRNRRRNGRVDWSPPGGVIDAGERLLEGLSREVAEETGLVVTAWDGPVYAISAEAPDMGWRLRVEVHRAVAYDGVLRVGDPDGIVDEVGFVALDHCELRLADQYPWVREPLLAWLSDRAPGRRFEYHVAGADPTTARVTGGRTRC